MLCDDLEGREKVGGGIKRGKGYMYTYGTVHFSIYSLETSIVKQQYYVIF